MVLEGMLSHRSTSQKQFLPHQPASWRQEWQSGVSEFAGAAVMEKVCRKWLHKFAGLLNTGVAAGFGNEAATYWCRTAKPFCKLHLTLGKSHGSIRENVDYLEAAARPPGRAPATNETKQVQSSAQSDTGCGTKTAGAGFASLDLANIARAKLGDARQRLGDSVS